MATPSTPAAPTISSYTDRGRGEPLVLLHGFPLDRRMWDAQVGRLSQRCRVIAPDFRGFGPGRRSDPFTLESLADDVHRFLEPLAAAPCVLAGLSMGGYVAQAYARKYAADLRGLILLDTKAAGDTPQAREGRDAMIALVRSSGASAVADALIPKLLAGATREGRPEVVRALREMIEDCPALTIEHALAALRDRPDLSDGLASIAVPTLIVVGDEDVLTPPHFSESMRTGIPGATLDVIRGAGHMSPMEQPEAVNRAIEQFLGELG